MKTTYSHETKVNVALQFLLNSDVTISKVASEFNVSSRSVSRWKDAYADDAKRIINSSTSSNRGFKPRNGRVAIIRSLLSTEGFLKKKTKDQYTECFNLCKSEGLSDLSYGLFINLRMTYLKLIRENKI